MKKMDMEELLLKKGFKKIEGEYTRDIWTIRFEGGMIEIYDSPVKEIGKYYYGPKDDIDLEFLLDTIKESCC